MQFRVRIGHIDVTLDVEPARGSEYRVQLNGRTVTADLSKVGANPVYTLLIDGRSYRFFVHEEGGLPVIHLAGHAYAARAQRSEQASGRSEATAAITPMQQQVTAPMPGLIVQVQVAVGDKVDRTTPLVIIESMKMNNQLRAQAPGTVKSVNVTQGQRVERGQVLVVLD